MLAASITLLCFVCSQENQPASKAVPHPLTKAEQKQILNEQTNRLARTTKTLEESPRNQQAVSQQADANFFLGKFKAAVQGYDRMVELEPRTDASHWRRGITYFYAGQFDKAAKQFERYHSYDNIDRENGIWRYLSQHKAKGRKVARQGLLKYKKDDREPFPAVYKLFAGEIEPEAILKQIAAAKISKTEREKRTFYAELYIGLNEFVEGRKQSAERHLHKAVATKWPRTAGFGPNYMWHVGRLQLNQLRKNQAGSTNKKPAVKSGPRP